MKYQSLARALAKTKGWVGLFVCSLGLFVVGCGSKGTVSGKVLYQGKPLHAGVVTFFPSSGGGSFTGRIQADGSYRVEKVTPGQAKIAIVPPTPVAAASGRGRMPPGMAEAVKSGKIKLSDEARAKMMPGQKKAVESLSSSTEPEAIPQQYSDAAKSGLECRVNGGYQTHDIELK